MIVYFIAHMLGDYYFQSQALSDYKDISEKGVLFHSIIYSLSFFFVFIMKYTLILINKRDWFWRHFIDVVMKEFLFVILVTVIHGVIDYLKFKRIVTEGKETKNIHVFKSYKIFKYQKNFRSRSALF